jgi:hypothetical protein
MFEAWAQQHGHYLHSRTTLYILYRQRTNYIRFSYARMTNYRIGNGKIIWSRGVNIQWIGGSIYHG